MQSFSTGAFRYYTHTQNYMRKKVESMSVKKPVVPAAAEAPAAEAKPARKTAKSAVKTEKAPKTEKTAHKGRPRFPLRSTLNLPASSITSPILWTAPRPITA